MKRILSVLLCAALLLACCHVTGRQVRASEKNTEQQAEQFTLLGDNAKLSWEPYTSNEEAGEFRSQEIMFSEEVTLTKLRLKIRDVYKWKYFRIYEFEALDSNGENVLVDSKTKTSKATISYGGGFQENVQGSAVSNIADGWIRGTSYYQYTPSAEDMENGYIEFTLAKPVAISSVRIWCNWWYDGKGAGAAPKLWEVYGDDGYLFYEDFEQDLSKWSDCDAYSLLNGAAMPQVNQEAVMYAGKEELQNYRIEADILGLSGEMGVITYYTDEEHCYRVIVKKADNRILLYKGNALLAEKQWSLGGIVTLAVTVSDGQISVWGDEVKMLDHADTSVQSGRFGLYAKDSTGAFEEVRVYKVGTPDTLPGDYPYEEVPEEWKETVTTGDFYVAEDGNDGWEGTLERPFATLTRAREAVREAKKADPLRDYVVMVRGGIYQLSETLQLNGEDGGQGAYRVTYVAYPDETPTISGKGGQTALEQLIAIEGTVNDPVRNLDLIGFQFVDTAWKYQEDAKNNRIGGGLWTDDAGTTVYAPVPAVSYKYATGNRLSACDFTVLEGGAVAFGAGTAGNLVSGCTFIGVGSISIQIGYRASYQTTGGSLCRDWENDRDCPRGIRICNNYFENGGTTDDSAAAVWSGYANHVQIVRNTIKKMPASEIYMDMPETDIPTTAHHNVVKQDPGCDTGLSGDMNYDDVVDIRDVIRIKRYLTGRGVRIERTGADLNEDSAVDQADLFVLRRKLLEQNKMPTVSATPIVVSSQVTGNPLFSEDNLLHTAAASTNGNADTLDGLTSGNMYSYDSNGKPEQAEEFVYQWDAPVSGDTLRLYANYAKDQAPAQLKLYVRQNGGIWQIVQNCRIAWDSVTDGFYEYADIPVAAKNITGLKVVVEEANLTWDHYIITELELLSLPSDKEGYRLVFEDEFDGESINESRWLSRYFPHATTRNCDTTYRMKDGKLCLYIDQNTENYADYTSMKVSSVQTYEKNLLHPGAVTTNVTDVQPYESFTCKYGYFEMRAKLPACGGGGHVAWWLIGTQDDAKSDGTSSVQNGEIDILETTLLRTNTFSPKVHKWDDESLSEYENEVTLPGDYADEYHIYAMDWTPSGITFYVDGEVIGRTDRAPQYRMAMLLGIYTDGAAWSGAANQVYPKEFSIDYVRVYQKAEGYGIE